MSKVTDKLLPDIHAWQNRSLDKRYPIVFIDGIRFKVKNENNYSEKSVYIAMGINMDGYKDILGFWISESESAKQWLNVLNELKQRGLQDVFVFCSDNLTGISEAIKAIYPKSKIQKCIVHQIRNSTNFVSYEHLKEFTADMKTIYTAINLQTALKNLEQFRTKMKEVIFLCNKILRKKHWRINYIFWIPTRNSESNLYYELHWKSQSIY